MTAIQLVNACIGTVSSREDGSVAFRVITAELRPSEKGVVMDFHGKACRVTIEPHDETPDESIIVDTEMGEKSPSARWRGVLFVAFSQGIDKRDGEDFDSFYRRQYARIIEHWKAKLNP